MFLTKRKIFLYRRHALSALNTLTLKINSAEELFIIYEVFIIMFIITNTQKNMFFIDVEWLWNNHTLLMPQPAG